MTSNECLLVFVGINGKEETHTYPPVLKIIRIGSFTGLTAYQLSFTEEGVVEVFTTQFIHLAASCCCLALVFGMYKGFSYSVMVQLE